MDRWSWLAPDIPVDDSTPTRGLLRADGGTSDDGDSEESEEEGASADGERSDDSPDGDRTNVEVTDAGEATPADPKWEEPDFDEIPEFEVGGERPTGAGRQDPATGGIGGKGSTAGRPNEARSPSDTRIREAGTEGYVVALELCARLPDDVRLPAEAADLVPAAVEAELEEDVQSFAAAEFDNPSPTVDTLEFVERADEVWLRLRLGIPPDAFADLDPDVIRTHALQELEGMF